MEENKENNNTPQKLKCNIVFDSENLYTDSTESQKNLSLNLNPSINGNNGSTKLEQDNSKLKKKKRVSFIDQIQSKTDIAQIIYINDRASLTDDKINSNKYEEKYRKQNTNISEYNKKDNQNNTDIYKIKRPKKKSLFAKRKIDKMDEKCGCIIF